MFCYFFKFLSQYFKVYCLLIAIIMLTKIKILELCRMLSYMFLVVEGL